MSISENFLWDDAAGLLDGTDSVTTIGLPSVLDIPAVTISKASDGEGGYVFTNNRSHTLIGIERLNMTKYADTIDIDYSLADKTNYLSSGYIMEIWTQGGNDIVTIGDTMPSDYSGYVGFGARVFGGAGNDQITGGGQSDWICGDFETVDNVTGNDTLYGGAGNDMIQGQGGSDKLYGGDGDDTLIVDSALKRFGKDKATGGHGEDYISLSNDHKQDVVYLNEVADSTRTAFDTINGFEAKWDTLDFRLIDADATKDGDHQGSVL